MTSTTIHSAFRKKIKVLFISHDTSLYGAQRILLVLLSNIDRRVFDPLLLIPYDGPLGKAVFDIGIPVIVQEMVSWVPSSRKSLKREKVHHVLNFFRTLLWRLHKLAKLINEERIDIIYTNTATILEGAIAASYTGRPHIWHIHEHLTGNSELSLLAPHRLYDHCMHHLTTRAIFCSKALLNDYPILKKKAKIVSNCLTMSQGRDRASARKKLMRTLPISARTQIVSAIGAMHRGKDFSTFISAAKMVSTEIDDTLFLLIGSGDEQYADLLKNQIRSLQLKTRVLMLGWRDDIPDILAASDVLVISSEQESFGLTAIEALYLQTPVVATRCGGPEEIVDEGETGFLVPIKHPVFMADAILKLLNNKELCNRMGAIGKERIAHRFSVERFAGCIEKHIAETVQPDR